jgi:hypothetical protein
MEKRSGVIKEGPEIFIEEFAEDIFQEGKVCVIKRALIEKAALLNRWNISDTELKTIILHHEFQSYNAGGKSLFSELHLIFNKLNPLRENYTPLPKETSKYLKGLYDSIYKRIRYFELEYVKILDRYHACESPIKKKSGRHSTIDREKYREEAGRFWKVDQNLTITGMIKHLRERYPTDTRYGDKIMREWIKDLCPDRKPGRRPKTI